MYRMKGNHGPRGVRMASEAFAFPISVPVPVAAEDRQPRNRLLAILAAGLGAALIIFGVTGLVVAASREAPELPEYGGPESLHAPAPPLFEGAGSDQLDHLVFAQPEDLA